jgi:hypothetical protein
MSIGDHDVSRWLLNYGATPSAHDHMRSNGHLRSRREDSFRRVDGPSPRRAPHSDTLTSRNSRMNSGRPEAVPPDRRGKTGFEAVKPIAVRRLRSLIDFERLEASVLLQCEQENVGCVKQ